MPIDVSGTAWSQVILPAVERPTGVYEVRINAGVAAYDVNLATSPAIRLVSPRRVFKEFGPIKKSRAKEDGKLEPDSWACLLRDFHDYAGTAAGGDLGMVYLDAAGSELAYNRTFLDVFFSQNLPYYVWLTRITDNGANYEIVFTGEIKANAIPRAHTLIDRPHETENRIQDVELECSATFGRLASATVQDLVDAITITDMVVGSSRPFYGGFAHSNVETYGLGTAAQVATFDTGIFDPVILSATPEEWRGAVTIAATMRTSLFNWTGNTDAITDDASILKGEYGISIGTILSKMASVADLDFTATTDFVPAFEYTKTTWNTGSLKYERTVITDPWNIAVSFNYVFGVNPVIGNTGSPLSIVEFPITWKRDETLDVIAGRIARQFGCRIEPTYNQTTGKPRIRFVPLRHDNGAFPTNLLANLIDSAELPRATTAGHVLVENVGVDTKIKCPAKGTGGSTTITIPFRTRAMGAIDATSNRWLWKDLIWFTGADAHWHGVLAFIRDNRSDSVLLEPNGWLHASYLYYYDSNAANTHYPASISHHPFADADWNGFYMVEACTEKSGTYTDRSNTLFGPAQYYANELTLANEPMQFERRYSGCLDSSDSMIGIKIGQTCTILVNGTATTFRSVELEIDPFTTSTKVLWEEVPASYSAIVDHKVEYLGDGSHSAGSSSQGANNGSGINTLQVKIPPGIGVKVGTTAIATETVYSYQGVSPFSSDATIAITQSSADDSGSPAGRWAGLNFAIGSSVLRGTLSAGYVPYCSVATNTLADSSLQFDGSHFAINRSPSGTIADLTIDSIGSAHALHLNGTVASTGHGLHVTHSGNHASIYGINVDIPVTTCSGVRITLPVSSARTAFSSTNNGSGLSALITGRGTVVAEISSVTSATAQPLYVHDHASSTATIQTIEGFGTGSAFIASRNNSGAVAPLMELNNFGAGTQATLWIETAHNAPAIFIDHSSAGSSARGIDITTDGTGDTILATATGNSRIAQFYRNLTGATADGVLIHLDHAADTGIALDVINDGTGDALKAITTNNARAGHFYRNVSGATTSLVTIHCDHASDVGAALEVQHDGNRIIGSFYRNVSGATDSGVFIHLDHTGDTGHALRVVQDGTGNAIRAEGKIYCTNLQVDIASAATDALAYSTDSDGNIAFTSLKSVADPECFQSIHRGDDVGGTVVLAMAPADALVQMTFQNEDVCNDQIEFGGGGSNAWRFEPTITPAGEDHGVSQITIVWEGDLPSGVPAWATANLSLYVRKNGAVNYRLDRRRYATGETKFLLCGSIDVEWNNGTPDFFEIWVSQDHATNTQTISNWEARVSTSYQHTDDCSACTP